MLGRTLLEYDRAGVTGRIRSDETVHESFYSSIKEGGAWIVLIPTEQAEKD